MKDLYIITRIRDVLTGFYLTDNKVMAIDCYEEDSLLGNIYIGKVDNIVKNINAAFVNISKSESCYLSLEDYKGEKKLKIGDEIPVQVIRDKIKSKQMAVSADISLNSDYVIVSTNGIVGASNKLSNETKNEYKKIMHGIIEEFSSRRKCREINYGALIRTKAVDISLTELRNITHELLYKLDDIMEQLKYRTLYSCAYQSEPQYISLVRNYSNRDIRVITDILEIYDNCKSFGCDKVELYQDEMISLADFYRLNQHLEKALNKNVYLKSGAYLVIEPTEALTVIDVNSGKAIKGNNSEEIILKINLEAAREVARQLRVRNISGIVIVDFINMKKEKDSKLLLEEISKYVYDDPIKVNVVGMTNLGLVEITRQKSKKSLDMIFS